MTCNGATGWGFIGEISSQRLRPYTAGFAAASTCVAGVVMDVLTPYMVNAQEWDWELKTGWFYAGIGLPMVIGMWLIIPETSNRSAAELDELYERKIKPCKCLSKVSRVRIKLTIVFHRAIPQDADCDSKPGRGGREAAGNDRDLMRGRTKFLGNMFHCRYIGQPPFARFISSKAISLLAKAASLTLPVSCSRADTATVHAPYRLTLLPIYFEESEMAVAHACRGRSPPAQGVVSCGLRKTIDESCRPLCVVLSRSRAASMPRDVAGSRLEHRCPGSLACSACRAYSEMSDDNERHPVVVRSSIAEPGRSYPSSAKHQ